MGRFLKPNEEFISNLSKDQIDELINLDYPMPNKIENILNDRIPDFRMSRQLATSAEIDRIVLEENYKYRKMDPSEAIEYANDMALDFLEKFPKYADIIEEVVIV